MATISDSGQVTIPEPIREALGLKPGSEVVFEYQGAGEVFIHKAKEERSQETPARTRFDRLAGSLKGKITTDEILAMTRGED